MPSDRSHVARTRSSRRSCRGVDVQELTSRRAGRRHPGAGQEGRRRRRGGSPQGRAALQVPFARSTAHQQTLTIELAALTTQVNMTVTQYQAGVARPQRQRPRRRRTSRFVDAQGWALPTVGRITSPWGYRYDPAAGYSWRMHYGDDIADGCLRRFTLRTPVPSPTRTVRRHRQPGRDQQRRRRLYRLRTHCEWQDFCADWPAGRGRTKHRGYRLDRHFNGLPPLFPGPCERQSSRPCAVHARSRNHYRLSPQGALALLGDRELFRWVRCCTA